MGYGLLAVGYGLQTGPLQSPIQTSKHALDTEYLS